MQVTDYLYPNDMIAQCEAAIQLLKKENEDIEILQGEILNFTEDELLISEKISKAKAYFYNYHLVFEKLRKANESDIIAFEKLRNIIVDEVHLDLRGDVIFATKQSADFNYESEKQKAEYYSKLAVSNSGLPMLSTVLHNYAMGHSMQASHWKQISDDCVEKMNLFDRIEQSTANLFAERDIGIPMEIIGNSEQNDKISIRSRTVTGNSEDNQINLLIDWMNNDERFKDCSEEEIYNIAVRICEKSSCLFGALYATELYSTADHEKIKKSLCTQCFQQKELNRVINEMTTIALSQEGVCEDYGNIVEYNDWYYGRTYGAPWCSVFVLWSANEVGLLDGTFLPTHKDCPQKIMERVRRVAVWYCDQGSYHCLTEPESESVVSLELRNASNDRDKKMIEEAQSKILYDNYTPCNGDFIILQPGAEEHHIGIVIGYDEETNIVYTVEGNKGNKVAVCSYTLDFVEVKGFCENGGTETALPPDLDISNIPLNNSYSTR